MTVERDVLERLDGLGYRWYVTGSWALAAYAEPRTTVDIDVVLEAKQVDYSTRIRAALSDDFRDLILAKLEWSEGTSELQLRDVASLIRLNDHLDWGYLSRYARALGIEARLEMVRDR